MDKSQQMFDQLTAAFDRVMAAPAAEFEANLREQLEPVIRAKHPKWSDLEVAAEARKRVTNMWPKNAVPFGTVKL